MKKTGWLNRAIQDVGQTLDFKVESGLLDFTGLVCQEMEKQNINKATLAARLHKHPSYISRVLGCNHNITFKTMVSIGMELGIDIQFKSTQKAIFDNVAFDNSNNILSHTIGSATKDENKREFIYENEDTDYPQYAIAS